MIIQLVTRTFTNKDEANIFEYFFCKQWKDLIKNIPNCKLRLIYNKEKPNTFNALWEFPNKFTQNRVMKLIKKHNTKFEGVIPEKTTNFSGDVKKEYIS
tara:strand:- start:265 stop:561 length:297 start_codon:yes stop_codon:yes gene_type:complete